MAKAIVHVDDNTVLGLHIACPNAGEIIQGFAVAFRKGGLTHQVITIMVFSLQIYIIILI